MILVFDTETTGKADFKSPASAEHQPHLVQLGAQLLDCDFNVRGELNLIVKPSGYIIPEEASDIHGVTQAVAMNCGVPLWCALSSFKQFMEIASVFVAHNISFDALVMATAFNRCTDVVGEASVLRDGFCTMHATTDLCKLPGNYGFKWPKLQEAYRHAFNEGFEGAHDAIADVRACARLYKWLLSKKGTEVVA